MSSPTQASSSLTIAGTRVAFVDQGHGAPVVLLHGMFGDHLDWEPELEPLSQQFRVIAVDLPGSGASGKPAISYTLDFYLDTLHGLFAALALDQVHLIGNSFGGQLAVLYALRYPAQVATLVLVDCGGFRVIPRDEREQTAHAFSETNLLNLHWMTIQYLFGPVFAHSSAAKTRYLERQTERLHTPDYPAYAHAIAKSIQLSLSASVLDRLGELRCPVLLLWGDRDTLCPVEQGREGLKHLRSGQLHILRDCGHMPQLEAPGEFLAALTAFLPGEPASLVPEPAPERVPVTHGTAK